MALEGGSSFAEVRTSLTYSAIPMVSACGRLGAPAELHESSAAQFYGRLVSFSYLEVECRPLRGPRDEYLSGAQWEGNQRALSKVSISFFSSRVDL